uniref:Uncharacterized protein n=1 Tax=Oryza sativa subsp. japonica TaxID=39947 RepID=Q6EP16_ORYSJ|nr:hypothetical protein [Oryza sativa Japonica Group]BAD29604.1 hypothetical protein [Oryza sativa Japonica Group]
MELEVASAAARTTLATTAQGRQACWLQWMRVAEERSISWIDKTFPRQCVRSTEFLGCRVK